MPLGILRVIAHLTSLGGIEPEEAICMATGNTARVYGLPVGVIEPAWRPTCASWTRRSARWGMRARRPGGDLCGISMVLIDGQIRIGRSRNTPPAARAAEVVKGLGPGGGGH